jgi:DNA polymerase IV
MTQRTIFHLDLDAFFCSVEELRNPSLTGKPFAVAGRPDQRGVVSSASYAARAFGVRNAMPSAQALRLCPRLILVPHSHGIYGEYSRKVMDLLREYGDAMQQLSVDEAFLDLTGFPTPPEELARELQSRIRTEIQLPSSVGVASGKLVAKMASGAAKPAGVRVVLPGDEAAFLAPMPVGELWGIGKATVPRLEALGIHTISDLQRADPRKVRKVFGDYAESVIERACGVDDSPVHNERDVKSISEETTFNRDIRDHATLRKVLLSLSDQVAARLRKSGLTGRTVQLKLRWSDFTTVTRQTTLAVPTELGGELFDAVEPLWLATWQPGEWVRLLGVGVSGLSESRQLALFDEADREKQTRLADTLDALRKQYGGDVVKRASLTRRPKRDT